MQSVLIIFFSIFHLHKGEEAGLKQLGEFEKYWSSGGDDYISCSNSTVNKKGLVNS